MSSDQVTVTPAGRPLSAGAIALMLLLCLSWGFNQVAVKLALPDIPPMLQAMIRSSGALLVLLLIGALPSWPYSSGWGYYPSGGLGLILIIIVVLVLLGRF